MGWTSGRNWFSFSDFPRSQIVFHRCILPIFVTASVILLGACASGPSYPRAVAYRVTEGNVAVLRDGQAYAPKDAPPEVKRAISAANSLVGLPYKWGGGHAKLIDSGYDCSGAVSYVLRNAGLMEDQMPSRGFLTYGERGEGEWITVYARDGHAYMVIAGLRFDTQGTTRQDGPKWRPEYRHPKNHRVRHPAGL